MASLTFGSVGDIVTVCGLVINAAEALSDSTGSAAEYQEVLREVRSLNVALQSASTVIEGDVHVTGSEQLRDALTHCKTCLNAYLGRIRKYHEALKASGGGGGSKSIVKDKLRKLQWHGNREDLARFRAEIASHLFAISTILTTYDIQANRRHRDALERFIESKFRSLVEADRNGNLVLQMDAELRKHHSTQDASFKQIFDSLSVLSKANPPNPGARVDLEKVQLLLDRLAAMMAQQEIPQKLEKTWTQEPAILDDALGRIFPIHLEFINSWDSFLYVLAGHFKGTPGATKIDKREFLLHGTAGRQIQFQDFWGNAFRPGEKITMSMLFARRRVARSSCPLCHADNEDATDFEVQCKECNTSYRRITEVSSESQTSDQTTYPIDIDASSLDLEPTEELHRFKRLALKAGTDDKADGVSERAIENLIRYGLAKSRDEAVAMLLAKAGTGSAGALPMRTHHNEEALSERDAQRKDDNRKALIYVNEVDHHARRNMQEIVSLTDCVSKLSMRSSDVAAPSETQASQAAQTHEYRSFGETVALGGISTAKMVNTKALGLTSEVSFESRFDAVRDQYLQSEIPKRKPTGNASQLDEGNEVEIGEKGDDSLGWYIFDDGRILGPYTGFQMHEADQAGLFPPSMLLKSTTSGWVMLDQFKLNSLSDQPFSDKPFREIVLPPLAQTDRLPDVPGSKMIRNSISKTLWQDCLDFVDNTPTDPIVRGETYRKLYQAISDILKNLTSSQVEQGCTLLEVSKSLLLRLNSIYKESNDRNLASQSWYELIEVEKCIELDLLTNPITTNAEGLNHLQHVESEVLRLRETVENHPYWGDFEPSMKDQILCKLSGAEERFLEPDFRSIRSLTGSISERVGHWLDTGGYSPSWQEAKMPEHTEDGTEIVEDPFLHSDDTLPFPQPQRETTKAMQNFLKACEDDAQLATHHFHSRRQSA